MARLAASMLRRTGVAARMAGTFAPISATFNYHDSQARSEEVEDSG